MAAFSVLASWVLSFSLQINSTIQRAMPATINSERPAWINLEIKMERSQAVIVAAEQLHATEAAIDAAYAHVADFAARLVRLRGETRLSSTVGQDALDEITTALGHLGNAQSAVVRGHGKLNITKVRIGCGAVATGGEDKPNQDLTPAATKPELRAVG